jgi:hypothetical protein
MLCIRYRIRLKQERRVWPACPWKKKKKKKKKKKEEEEEEE